MCLCSDGGWRATAFYSCVSGVEYVSEKLKKSRSVSCLDRVACSVTDWIGLASQRGVISLSLSLFNGLPPVFNLNVEYMTSLELPVCQILGAKTNDEGTKEKWTECRGRYRPSDGW